MQVYRSSSRKQHVFTLIELLVVIAIIAILAAILFPVFAQAREKARSAACLSNTKQLGLATQMYTEDYDETLPDTDTNTVLQDNGNDWSGAIVTLPNGRRYQSWVLWEIQLYPYVKNEGVFACPSDQDANIEQKADGSLAPLDTNPSNPQIDAWGKAWPLSYAPNDNIAFAAPYPARALAAITFPASTYFLADNISVDPIGFNSWNSGFYSNLGAFNRVLLSRRVCPGLEDGPGRPYLDPGSDPRPCARHLGGNTWVFTDGHAKWENNLRSDCWHAIVTRTDDDRGPNDPAYPICDSTDD